MKTIIIRTLTLLLAAGPALAFAQEVRLEAQDQEIRGTTLTLDHVTLAQDGFVVVHATDASGDLVLTPPLGLTYLEAGAHDEVDVDLHADELAKYAYEEGGMIVPMLHVDANGDGAYQFPDGGDVPVTRDEGAVVVSIDLTLLPSLATHAQTLAGRRVTIDTVVAAQDGFVVVHALDRNGDAVISPPLGVAQVEAGVTRYLGVELDDTLLEEYGYDGPKAIVPMLHVDDGNGAYEFPDGPDLPVMADGAALVSPLTLSMPAMGQASVATGQGKLSVGMDGLSVTLPSVTLTQPGFVVLHAQNENGGLSGLPVLGASDALPAGTSNDVTIPIARDQAPMVGDTAYAMVHVDDGDGVYRFPASDPPFEQKGEVVVVPFTLN